MDWLLIVASMIAFLTAMIHVFAGGNDVAKPLLESSLPSEEKYALYACWHFVSTFFIFSASLFLLTGLGYLPSSSLILILSLLWLTFGLIFFAISLSVNTLRGIFRLPQWVLLIPVGVLGLIGRV